MAYKFTKARRAAFARMRAALKRKRGGGNRSRKRRTRVRHRRAPRVSVVKLSNPRRKRARRGGGGGGFASRAIALVIPRGGSMARKRRKHRSRRRHHRNPGALMVNPRRGRRHRRSGSRRRRRNPGAIREGIGLLIKSLIPALAGGGILGFIDAKFLGAKGTAFRTVGKGVLAGVLGIVGRKYLGPAGAGVAVGAVLGSIGYEGGYRLGGGVVADSKKAALKELLSDPGDDQEVRAAMGRLEGVGDDMGESYGRALNAGISESYESALRTDYSAQSVGDDMGDDD
jgi:hypothetical protein